MRQAIVENVGEAIIKAFSCRGIRLSTDRNDQSDELCLQQYNGDFSLLSHGQAEILINIKSADGHSVEIVIPGGSAVHCESTNPSVIARAVMRFYSFFFTAETRGLTLKNKGGHCA